MKELTSRASTPGPDHTYFIRREASKSQEALFSNLSD